MDFDKKALSDITVFNKYARFNKEAGRRESWEEIVTRNMEMHITKYPSMESEIRQVYKDYVYTKKVLPSMRSLQFGGRPILLNESRMFNCAFMPAESVKFFSELMFLLLGGTGVGYSVQKRHTNKLPKIKHPESDKEYKFQVQDSIVGWSDAIKVLCKAFFNAGTLPVFDYRDIREKGAELITTGGQAPGPDPLRVCISKLEAILRKAIGRKLTTLEVHDMACTIADAVLAGGIRRAAMICLFDAADSDLLTCKSRLPVKSITAKGDANAKYVQVEVTQLDGSTLDTFISDKEYAAGLKDCKLEWYYLAPQRGRANNSAVLHRDHVTKEQFQALIKLVEASGCGEPGIYWSNDYDLGTNPCAEIGLNPYGMCNLTEINAAVIKHQKDFNNAAKAAAFIGTLQAGYTDFHYLNPKWKQNCEEEALLGVSMTGIASNTVTSLDMEWAAKCAVEENARVAKLLGIRSAARITAVKPAGTTSLVLGTSSGIHAWHAPFYLRRMRAGKDEALAQYMQRVVPELVEQDQFNPKQVVLCFPQKSPEGAVIRTETMFDLLERVKHVATKWVQPGHNTGDNTHNVSCTISVKPEDWASLAEWMWNNKQHYNGISVLPYNGGTYVQAPFEDITEAEYLRLLPYLESIDISQVFELDDTNVNLAAELACAGGACEIL